MIRDYVESNPEEKVIRGIGWNPALYGGMPTYQEHDASVSDRPAILMDFTIHDLASQQKSFAAAVAAGTTTFLNPAVAIPNVNNPEGMWEDYELTMELLTALDARGELTMRAFVQPGYKNPDADFAANAKGLDVITHVDGSATVRAIIDAIVLVRECLVSPCARVDGDEGPERDFHLDRRASERRVMNGGGDTGECR